MVQTYFALLSLDGFDMLDRRIGYARAVQQVDALCDEVATALPQARGLRASRTDVEFCFQCGSQADAARMMRSLRGDLTGELAIDGRPFPRAITIAALPCPDGRLSEPLVRQAEALLRRARRDGVPVLLAAAGSADQEDSLLMADLREAIDADGLQVHYQPKLRARTGELAGAEALVRWTHPLLGPVGPDRFIPMAERSGDIRALTHAVVARTIADQATLAAAGLAIPVHVNISAPLLAERPFIGALLDQVAGHTRSIGFEITETAMIDDPEGALAQLQRVAEAGVRLAIDDYGSGFSSLAYLQRLPVQELKIDRMFIARLSTSARDPLLVRSTIDLAHALEMEVTAEGVETAAALALLQVMGCDVVQGFFLSRALPLDGLIGFARTVAGGAGLPRPATLRERLAERRALAGGQP